ncbi:unnamed protein product [Anisakis simplex]|uniref:Mannosyltransferase n=1 Tax=Anisakis simplex TaxID=6269 RepID=A0A0M3J7E4_ANISI|nr:unnamed protein product [Anisakis simplex]
MTKKNLSLLKRSSNRSANKPSMVTGGRAEDSTLNTANNHSNNGRNNDEQKEAFLNDPEVKEHQQADRYAKLYVPSGDMDMEWQPASSSVFKILFSLRISAAMWSAISDCDEVYNYWEPLHLFLYGSGFQTWEYSPVYAIRFVSVEIFLRVLKSSLKNTSL